jgi:hypothetical protein
MKKLIFAAVSLLFAVSLSAQPGIVAGVTSSATDLTAAKVEIGSVTNYHFGLAFRADLGLIGIQPAVIYNVKGQSLSALASASSISSAVKGIDFKTGFIEVPVQIQAGIHFGDMVRVFGFAEPFVGYAVSNEKKTTDKIVIKNNWDNIKNRLEYGASLGFGADLFRFLQVEVKYFWNFDKLYKDGTTYGSFAEAFTDITNSIKETKCNGICASVGFFF